MSLFDKIFGSYSKKELKSVIPIAEKVLELVPKYEQFSDSDLKGMTAKFKEKFKNGESLDSLLPDAFAVCCAAAKRVLNQTPFKVQIIGAIILHQGRIAEMKTGEGKTLTATLAVYLNAITENGVHVVTVNDYLAKFQSEWMGKLYKFLGLTVGLVYHDMENNDRKKAYTCDITYATNNELGFDYLRDNMVIYKEQKVQRGFNYAIVDEVDSILIDEARTPLIISGQGDKSTDLYLLADKFARSLSKIIVKEEDSKAENEDLKADYIVDEKAKNATLTPAGVKKAESHFGVENLMDADNMTLLHHINQAIRAHGIMHLDTDYVVNDGQVVIVDEFTGRLMTGRRYNEGLHQAIEAKEGVKVERESKTLATITFQNYFRLYKKLSGMTGTAMTEEEEFRSIYKLDVIEIPTNKPIVRIDHQDSVYKTEKGKYMAVIEQIIKSHEKGQPVLVGTVSVDKSEMFSLMLKKKGVKHVVLNAKYHDKEAEIVAQAGKFGAVTIATNMAGRGTDIILGGNSEFLAKADLRKAGFDDDVITEAYGYSETDDETVIIARKLYKEKLILHKAVTNEEAEKVKKAGGLFIIGTERHESRRIDNQLRGRSGRQGDMGESRFYISLEDDIMRLFGGEKMQSLMNTLKIEEDQAIENKILTNSLESAQKKVEMRNFGIRKNVLQYDDVMNRQREIIYGQRDKVLNGENLKNNIIKMIEDTITDSVSLYLTDETVHDNWNLIGLRDHYLGFLTDENDLKYTPREAGEIEKKDITDMLIKRAMDIYTTRENEFGEDFSREFERVILLRTVDTKWMDHIDNMYELKRGIGLRAYAQRDPVVEYRFEGFEMFDAMNEAIKEDTVRALLTIQVRKEEDAPKREQIAKPSAASFDDGTVKKKPIVKKTKIGENDPCPCGSGKKYKKCCGME